MDAVELNYPVDVSKLRVSGEPLVSTSIKHKDGIDCVSGLVSTSWDKTPDAELSRHAVQQSDCRVGAFSESYDSKGASGRLTLGPELVKLQRRSSKISRSSSGSSKRQCMAPPEDNVSSVGADDVKDVIVKPGSSPTKCNSPEKNQMAKQRRKYGSNRSEKRNARNSMKPKCETFSMKSGLASFGIGAGGSNLLGLYGLKAEVHDITKLFDEISINELLDDTYECPSLGKDKGNKTDAMNGNFDHLVRKALSVLPYRKPAQPHKFSQIDSSPSKELPIYPPSTASQAESDVNGDNQESFPADISSNKSLESCGKPEIPTSQLDSVLCLPRDVLERLSLPPPKDLDSLLLDAAKPSFPSRSTSDLRSGKQISRRPCLPPFPWSHASNGHCRTTSDAVKCSTSRITCQGRWVKIAKIASSGSETDSFTDLDLLTYDQSLVPLISNADGSDKRTSPSTDEFPSWEKALPKLAIDSKASGIPLESGSKRMDQVNGDHCPRLLAAAQTLCDISTNPLRQNRNGFLRWSKKPFQKPAKACKSKLIEKSGEKYSAASASGSAKLVRHGSDPVMPLKRPKLAKFDNKKDPKHSTCVREGTSMPSPTPRPSGSSPVKSVTESSLEARHSASTVVKKPRPKLRKLMPVDWSRGRDKPD